MSEREQWLASLKVGDQVAVDNRPRWRGPRYWQTKVLKVTPTRITTGRGAYSRKTGVRIGEAGFLTPRRLVPLEGEAAEAIERHRLIERIDELSEDNRWSRVSTATLRAVLALLEGEEGA